MNHQRSIRQRCNRESGRIGKGGESALVTSPSCYSEEARTTKVRIVYDASSKEKKSGTSLNDCLHVEPLLNPLLYDILL